MKKMFLFLTSVLVSAMIYSQESKMAIGFQVAPSITSIRGNTLIDRYDSRFVFSPGITIDYKITNHISFNSGLAFERKGAKSNTRYLDNQTTFPTTSQDFKFHFDYLTLPLMFVYNTNTEVNFYIGGGNFLGFLVSEKINFSKPNDDVDDILGLNESTKKIDFGLSFLAGITTSVNNKLVLDIGLRDYMGLVNISRYYVVNNGAIKTNSYSLVIGLKYKI
ncbi:MAG: PorT family protein [Bacteroidetes bacterium]|nr:MAG: PorT family protein [Bacteroidota bacterium]